MDKLALNIPGSSTLPSQKLASPSGLPSALGGDFSSSGAALFQTGVSWLLYVATALAILMLMWGGIQWITSAGDPEKVASARKKLTFAVIGLVISVGAFFLVRVIVTVLGGSGNDLLNPATLFNATSSATLRTTP
jgi:hypothetical protein